VKLPTQRLTSGRRMVMLAVFSLIPSVVLLVEVVRGAVRDGAVIAILSGLTFLLVYFRLVGVVDMHRKAFTRERVLRRAGAALVSATEIGQVDAAIRVALGELLPAYRLVLLLSPAEEPQPGDRCVAVGPSTVSVTPSGGGSTLRRVEELGPRVAERIEGFETALICPLVVEDRLSGDIQVGMIVLAAPEDALVGLEGAVDVLASQAAMAVERIGLCDEIYRRRSEEYFRTLVHNMSDVILILEDDDTVRYASPAAATLFGPDELVGRSLYDLLHPRERPGARRAVAAARGERAASQEPAGGDWNVLPSGGKRAQVEVSFQDLRGDQTVRGLVVTMRDVTERRRLERELTHQAYHDALTGLANRILFTQRMHQAIAGAVRTGQVIGVLIVDLDDFKIINDTMGHGCGDELLASVGRRLISAVRPRDTVARLGGDEFAILMRDAGEEAEVERLADQVLATFVEPVTLGGQIITCAASVGLTTSREMADDGQELLRQADLALYMAKSSGKGRAVLYQPELHSAIRQRLELRAELDQSLNDGDFVLYYQPIVDLATGEPVGVEALVRWIHPAKGLVHPGQFIDVAEESGLIVPLGAWVLREAIAAIARWHSELPNGRMLYLSVNVSASQFRAPDFVDQVMEFLKQYDVAPRYLLLEITESLLLRDDDRVWTDLLALRSAGVRVAIDDFGTGYSSLSYLRQVPIDIVKIDKSFVETVSTSQQQRALVDGIIGLTRTLGLEVVAEGIEESTEREVLCEIGCPLGQGFLFAQPMSYGDAIQWMRAIEVAA
ncbi:MAG: EAL domain-containing protein, partial [Micromonosporaceae bacterium]|nr:EAL domain-containing protein [Micromonosporaceae bacterium]